MFTASETAGRALIKALLRCHRELVAYLEAELAVYELDLLSYSTLASLVEEGAASVKEVGERLGLSDAERTAVLARLEQARLTENTPNPRDGRSRLITASDRGRTLYQSTRHLHRSLAESLSESKNFSHYDLGDLIRLTERVTELLEESL